MIHSSNHHLVVALSAIACIFTLVITSAAFSQDEEEPGEVQTRTVEKSPKIQMQQAGTAVQSPANDMRTININPSMSAPSGGVSATPVPIPGGTQSVPRPIPQQAR